MIYVVHYIFCKLIKDLDERYEYCCTKYIMTPPFLPPFVLVYVYIVFLFLDYEEFLDLVRGENSGFGRRQRQAFRQLLKQTVEFIVAYKYSYQNQYSCSPPPYINVCYDVQVPSELQPFCFA